MTFETILDEAKIQRMQADGYWTNRTILDDFNRWVAETPDKEVIYDGRVRLTYRELMRLVRRCAGGLLDLGVKPGTVVSYQIPNWHEFVVIHLATTMIGAVNNPLIPIYREREVSYMLSLAESHIYIAPKEFRGFDYEAMIMKLKDQLPSLQHVMIIGQPTDPSSLRYEEWMKTDWEEKYGHQLEQISLSPNDVTLLMFTSGTTGEAKGVLHTHNTLMYANEAVRQRLGMNESDVIHMASTFAHLTGFLYGVRLPIQLGARAVYQDVWNAERFVELIAQEKITFTMGATPFVYDLLRAPNLREHDISSLRIFISAGAPIPRPLLEEAVEKLPDCRVLGGWGQTENGLVTIGRLDDPVEILTTTDGFPLPGMEIRIVDPAGNPVPTGVQGHLEVKGPTLFVGYARRPEMTREQFRGDWFQTGDLGVINEKGYLSIKGRVKDVIIRGGENIPVAEVENVLHAHPDIEHAAVVAMPDPRLQERACAFVILREGATLTLEQLQQYMQEQGVAKTYWPERLEVVQEFPRTPSGKIQKYKLREEIRRKLMAGQ